VTIPSAAKDDGRIAPLPGESARHRLGDGLFGRKPLRRIAGDVESENLYHRFRLPAPRWGARVDSDAATGSNQRPPAALARRRSRVCEDTGISSAPESSNDDRAVWWNGPSCRKDFLKQQGPDSFSDIRALASIFAVGRRLMPCLPLTWISGDAD
jgi:hypothetical protein